MIKINRSLEPPQLTEKRAEEIERVKAIAAIRPPTSKEIGTAYDCVKEELWRDQKFKCCFCEWKEQVKYKDVEHYRPKTEVQHATNGPIRVGYWWLAWTWENLMFSCPECNRSYKRILFPLENELHALSELQLPPGLEAPLLLNPFDESGVDHIQFRLVKVKGKDRWVPFARNKSKKGEATIKVAGLDRDTLLELYEDHYKNCVHDRIFEIQQAIVSKDPVTITTVWTRQTRRLLDENQPLIGLSHDMLDHYFPESLRKTHNIILKIPF